MRSIVETMPGAQKAKIRREISQLVQVLATLPEEHLRTVVKKGAGRNPPIGLFGDC